jgi:hypothetical protein
VLQQKLDILSLPMLPISRCKLPTEPPIMSS